MSSDELRARLAARRTELVGRRLVVLAGGSSAERAVSLNSGRSVAAALLAAGHNVVLAEVPAEAPLMLQASPLDGAALPAAEVTGLALLGSSPQSKQVSAGDAPPVVISMLHGSDGENGTWQGLLQLLGLPHTSAGVKGSAVAMDKVLTKRLLEQLGVPTPRWAALAGKEVRHVAAARVQLCAKTDGFSLEMDPEAAVRLLDAQLELVAKPVSEGSSVGLLMFQNNDQGWVEATRHFTQFGDLLVEERIRGRELTLSIIGCGADATALPLIEIRPGDGVYDYEHKYTAGASQYICPAELDAQLAARIAADGLAIYRALELEPGARLDVLLDSAGNYYFLEANTLPGFTPTSLLPKAAQAAGISYVELLELLVLCGLERWEAAQGRRVDG